MTRIIPINTINIDAHIQINCIKIVKSIEEEIPVINLYRRNYMRIPQYTDTIPTIITVHICTAVVNNVKMNSIGIIELFLWFLFITPSPKNSYMR